jgi:glycosyltransferase involved in cell wall biosynthesis
MPPPARLIDLTRLVSRLGRGPLTGVDRVELAYLDALLAGHVPVFGLVRTALGFVLLDRAGADCVAQRAAGTAAMGHADWLGRWTRRRQPARARAEADLRRLALARCAGPLLGRMLRRRLPADTSYLNLGHANLAARRLAAIKAAGLRIAVLVHDVIPLDYPQFTRPGISQVFARKMAAVAAHADLVIHTTEDARNRTARHFARMGRVPPGVVAPLGVPKPKPDAALIPPGLDMTQPYFVTVGTIEPRKNHVLLLDVWDRLPQPKPKLYIIGARGWANEAVFTRLDGAVAALLQGARALLFPSLAEGYGLPPIEAMALGVPVLCAPLTVYHETMGDYPVYLDPSDSYPWLETIIRMGRTEGKRGAHAGGMAIPTWADHFNRVLSLI